MRDRYGKQLYVGQVVVINLRCRSSCSGRIIRFTTQKVEVMYYYNYNQRPNGTYNSSTVLKFPEDVTTLEAMKDIPL